MMDCWTVEVAGEGDLPFTSAGTTGIGAGGET